VFAWLRRFRPHRPAPSDLSSKVPALLDRLYFLAEARGAQAPREIVETLATCRRIAAKLERRGRFDDAEMIRAAVFTAVRNSPELEPPPYAALAMPVPRPFQKIKVGS
jgi:hypothetical protein